MHNEKVKIDQQEHDEWLAQLVGLQIGLLKRQMQGTTSENKLTSVNNEDSNKTISDDNEVLKSSKHKVSRTEERKRMRNKKVRKKKTDSAHKTHIEDGNEGSNLKDKISANRDSPLEINDIVEEGKESKAVMEKHDSVSMSMDVSYEKGDMINEAKKEKGDKNLNDADQTDANEDAHSTCSSTASECSFGDFADDREDTEQIPWLSRDARSEIYEYLARFRKSRGDQGYDIKNFDPVLKDFLAVQRIDNLFCKEASENKDENYSCISSPHMVQSRAALTPINNPRCREPCHIQRRSVDIGLGVSCGIDLSKLGHCNYTSAKVGVFIYYRNELGK